MGMTNSMLFPSFEIAIRADLIKPACIIEVFQETLTGSRYFLGLRTSPARSTGNFRGSRNRELCDERKPDAGLL